MAALFLANRDSLGPVILVYQGGPSKRDTCWSCSFANNPRGHNPCDLVTRFQTALHPRVEALEAHSRSWFLLNAFPALMFSLAESSLPSNLAGILNATTPLTTALAVLLIFKGEQLSIFQGVGLGLGFVGVVVLTGQLNHLDPRTLPGVLLLVAATCSYGVAFPYTRKFLSGTQYSATSLATAQLVAATALLGPLALGSPIFPPLSRRAQRCLSSSWAHLALVLHTSGISAQSRVWEAPLLVLSHT